MASVLEYDLVVIGSGPGGQKAAIAAAKLGKTVAVIERGRMLGGVCVNTGTIPSKTLREAVVYLTGMSQRELYGASYRVKEKITPADLLARTQHVITKEQDVVRSQLMRNRVDLHTGHGRFVDAHTICVDDQTRGEQTTVRGEYIVIATGTKPARPAGVEFDEDRVLDSDGILDLKSLPTSMVVVGAGVIGIEYASMFAALGTKVTVVEKRDTMLDFCDPEVVEALKFHLRDLAVTFRFGEEVTAVDVGAAGTVTTLASGKQIPAETVMYSAGRQGQTEHLDAGERRPGDRQPRADLRRRPVPDQGRPHLRRRRRDRLPRPGRHVDGPGPAGRLSRVRRAGEGHDRAAADRHLLDPRGVLRRRHRGGPDPRLHPLRGRGVPVSRAGPRPDRRRLVRHAQAAGVHRGPAGCWACTSSAPTPPNWCTSARP